MNQPSEFTEEPTLPPRSPAEYVDEPTLASPKVDDTSSSRVQASESDSNDPRSKKSIREFGDYEILEEIARGGMGVVYKAKQISLNRLVALKMILAGQLASPEDVKRFYLEAESAAGLSHPGIVPIFEIGEQSGQHFFSMGFVDGPSLANVLKEGPLKPEEAADCLAKVCEAIQYAHDHGVIHRDLKPGNILLANDPQSSDVLTGNSRNSTISKLNRGRGTSKELNRVQQDAQGKLSGLSPRVTDFGLAKHIHADSDLTGTGQILGTPSYMPPEQADGKLHNIGPAADLYALGAILYCMLTGRPPFQSANPVDTLMQVMSAQPISPRQLNPSIPKDLETICLKCIEKHPAKRYSSAAELLLELRRFLQGEPIQARPISSAERTLRWLRRRPAIAAMGLVVLASIAAVGITLFTSNQRLAEERDTAVKAENESRKQKLIAESRLDKAILAVDQMMIRVASERWAKRPELQDERRAVLEDAVKFYQSFVGESGEEPRIRFEAAKAHSRVAHIYMMLSELEKSDIAANTANGIFEGLIEKDPTNGEYLIEAANNLSTAGKIDALSAAYQEALSDYKLAIQYAQRAVDTDSKNSRYRLGLLDAKSYYCYFCLAYDKTQAEKELKNLMQEAREIDHEGADAWERRLALAFALTVQGAYQLSEGTMISAFKSYQEADSILQDLKILPASSAKLLDQYQYNRAIVSVQLGLCNAIMAPDESMKRNGLQLMNEGRAMLEELLVINPKAFPFQVQLLQTIRGIIQVQKSLREDEQVKALEIEADRMAKQLAQDHPNIEWLSLVDALQSSNLWVEKVREGELEDFEKTGTDLVARARPSAKPDVQYNFACAYALASSRIEDRKEEFQAKAVSILEELFSKGYFRSEIRRKHVPKDTDLDALRQRSDFVALLKKIQDSPPESKPIP